MRDDAMGRLRRENPVPETMPPLPIEPVLDRLDHAPRPAAARRWPWQSMERVAVGLSLLLALAVAGLAVALLGGHGQKSSSLPATSQVMEDVQAPTLRQLFASFAVLRSRQSKADLSLDREVSREIGRRTGERVLDDLPRLVSTLGNGERLFLTVELNRANRRYSLFFWLANAHGGRSIEASYFPVPLRPGVWASVVPDGVGRVQWSMSSSLRCRARNATSCVRRQWFPVDLAVHNNVAVVRPPVVIGCTPAECRAIHGTRVIWYGASGEVMALNHPAQPQQTAGPFIPRRLSLLEANGIGDARFGTPERTTVASLSRLYGAPEIPGGPLGGCSEVGWAGLEFTSKPGQSSATTTLHVELRVVFNHSRLVGYSYYQSVPFRGGHQPALTLDTARGLTLGTSPAHAQAIYGHAFAVGQAVMGAGVPWTVTTPSGRIYGLMTLPEPRFQQIIQTINAGTSVDSGCP